MNQEIFILSMTAATIGFFHTLFGPDHYLPLMVMAKARNWNAWKTVWITIACGLGHVGSSVVLGLIGIVLGISLSQITIFESVRGSIIAWMLVAFGIVYFIWGLVKVYRGKAHSHHLHFGNHDHTHTHNADHTHPHETDGVDKKANITVWVIFMIFVFGPCEPLIPIFMYPAAQMSIVGLVFVTVVFTVATLGTMLTLVMAGYYGINVLKFEGIQRFMHPIAGATIFLSGFAIIFLGL